MPIPSNSFLNRMRETIRRVDGLPKDRRGNRELQDRYPHPQAVFAVRVTKDGGADGAPPSDAATWTYTAENDAGTHEYGTGLTPEMNCRPAGMPIVYAPDGSWATATFDSSGDFVLLQVAECYALGDPCVTAERP